MRLVKFGLSIASCLVLTAAMATPTTVGRAVGGREAGGVTGANSVVQGTTTTTCCTPSWHTTCWTCNGGTQTYFVVTNSTAGGPIGSTNNCPCSACTYPITGGKYSPCAS